MMLLKCCIQYTSKFGKLSSGHRTGKGQFSFQSQRKVKNAQTTAQLHSFHMLAKEYWKFSKLGLNSELPDVQTRFRKGRGIRSNCQHLLDHRKKQENSRKTSTSALLTMLKPLTVCITTNCGKFLKKWKYQITLPASWQTWIQVKKQQLEPAWKTDCLQIGKGVRQGCILSPGLFNLYAEYIMWNARLDEAETGIRIAGRNINNLWHVDDTTLMAQDEE